MKKRNLGPEIYDKKYFDSERCEGFAEYKKNRLSPIKQIQIDLLKLKKGDVVLDIGCGRGDIPNYLSQHNYDFWATDYSQDAIDITKKRVKQKYRKQVILADARTFLIKNAPITKIVIGDVVEHMVYSDAIKMINKSYDQLSDGGIMVIHTAPNLWFKKYSYPLIRFVLKMLSFDSILKKLDENIEATYHYHLDEYSPLDLHNIMEKTKFKKFKVWVNRDALRSDSKNYLDPMKKSPLLKVATWIINNPPFIYVLGNDLFVLATK